MRFARLVMVVMLGVATCAAYDNGYARRATLTIDHTKVPNTDRSNFPVLVKGTYAELAHTDHGGQVTSESGYDIIFTSDAAGNTALYWELESYNHETGAIIAWVKVGTVATASDTAFYMFYGKSGVVTFQSTASSVWDANYQGVWHFAEGTGTSVADSTTNARTGTKDGSTAPAWDTSSYLGTGVSSGTDGEKIALAANLSLGATHTISFWLKTTNTDYMHAYGPSKSDTTASLTRRSTETGANGNFAYTAGYQGGSVTSATRGSWMYVVLYRLGSDTYAKYYVNGSQLGSNMGSIWNDFTMDYLMKASSNNGGTQYWDEIRVSNTNRSADWIATEYNNQNDPSTFYGVTWDDMVSAPTITTTSPLTTAYRGVAYSINFAADGTPTITWGATDLPAWATLSSGGTLSGTPNALGTSVIAVTATNDQGSDGPDNFSLTVSANACESTQNGNWSAAATWTSCGGGVPLDGDTVTIKHEVTINQHVGTVAGGGMKNISIVGAGAKLLVDGAGQRTITFGSTGADPVGSGTAGAPGADATMYGIMITSGALDFSAATATNYVKITTADPTYKTYIKQRGTNDQIMIKLHYTVLENLGANVEKFTGIYIDDFALNSTLSIDHCLFTGPWMAVEGFAADTDITFNTVTGRRSGNTFRGLSINYENVVVEDNTEHSPAANGIFLQSGYANENLQANRNAASGTADYYVTMFQVGGGGTDPSTYSYNIHKTYPTALGTFTNTIGATGGPNLFTNNMSDGAYEMFAAGDNSATVSDNWGVATLASATGQGVMILNGGSTTSTGNVFFLETAQAGGGTAMHWHNSTVIIDHSTYAIFNFTGDPSGVQFSDGPGDGCINCTIRNTIMYGGGYAFRDWGDGTNVYNDDYAGVGAHHNLSFGWSIASYWRNGASTRFDNGTDFHPSAVYGDVVMDPKWVDTSRRFTTYDALQGGPGTFANFFTELGKRCGLNGTFNPAYSPAAVWAYLRAGWAPRNLALATGASDGTFIGAVKPVVMIGCVQ